MGFGAVVILGTDIVLGCGDCASRDADDNDCKLKLCISLRRCSAAFSASVAVSPKEYWQSQVSWRSASILSM